MLEEIELKIEEIVRIILSKPTSEITKSDYDILTSECFRIKNKLDSAEHNKRLAEMMTSLLAK